MSLRAILSRAATVMVVLVGVSGASPVLAGSAAQEVAAANQAFFQAFSDQDMGQMEQIWRHGPEVRMIGPRASAVVEGWPAVQDGWQKVFDAFQEISIAMPEPSVRAGETVAWVVGLEHFKGVRASGEPIELTVLATNVFEKVDGVWRMVHHHASLPPKE